MELSPSHEGEGRIAAVHGAQKNIVQRPAPGSSSDTGTTADRMPTRATPQFLDLGRWKMWHRQPDRPQALYRA